MVTHCPEGAVNKHNPLTVCYLCSSIASEDFKRFVSFKTYFWKHLLYNESICFIINQRGKDNLMCILKPDSIKGKRLLHVFVNPGGKKTTRHHLLSVSCFIMIKR